MSERPVDRQTLLDGLPPVPSGALAEAIGALIRRVDRKVIVLDDDPTGTQTVHDIPVVTRFSVAHLARELQNATPASYVLTNSRSFGRDEAVALNREIARNLRAASAQTGRDFVVISRSDSTLRGHFPAELETLQEELGQSFDGWILCPFFEEGGRLTIGDVHYVAEGEQLIPAAQTPFAADAAFGYTDSHLHHWVGQKSDGRIAPEQITSLSIEELRSDDWALLAEKLSGLSAGSVCVVNAACQHDLSSAVLALLEAEASGKRFLYRTAASFVATRAGIGPRPLLAGSDFAGRHGRGILVVVGSHVPKTTEQLRHLLEARRPPAYELRVPMLLDDAARPGHIAEVAARVADHLAEDATVVVYTSRELAGGAAAASLAIGRQVSQSLVAVVGSLSQPPRAIVAKGGITASDVATEACRVERATVMGQMLPGVPVWQCGPESRFPEMPLVVFPGNVGGTDALAAALDRLSAAAD